MTRDQWHRFVREFAWLVAMAFLWWAMGVIVALWVYQ